MTGIADLYILMRKPHSKDARKRVAAIFKRALGTCQYEHNRFVVLSWKRTGSNLLCGILFHHPEITMHNELFNPIDIFTYYQNALEHNNEGDRWTSLNRNLYPEAFLEHIWTGRDVSGESIREDTRAVGFKSFPDHWWETRNDSVFDAKIMEDVHVKKVVLFREDELAVYVSMKRAEVTGLYMKHHYPDKLRIKIDPAAFQVFLNNYRDTFRRRYTSLTQKQDTFRISYEQLTQEEYFEKDILPLLWDFLGVDNSFPLKKLRETVKQADPAEDLSTVIENYEELEYCFRHTDVKHFKTRKDLEYLFCKKADLIAPDKALDGSDQSWSILLPICSRNKQEKNDSVLKPRNDEDERFDCNRLFDLTVSSQYNEVARDTIEAENWERLCRFADSLKATSSPALLRNTECVVGIDADDAVFRHQEQRIRGLLPCKARFVTIEREMYGRVCRIWNYLGAHAQNNFIVLLGDDIVLEDKGWQSTVMKRFLELSQRQSLPFGAACVALYDESFPGFPTFPVVHRWHVEAFGTILPRQFVNQGGDPYLFNLYSRFGAAAFVPECHLKNTIGGDDEARYKKYEINWKGQILRLNLAQLENHLGRRQTGVCLDIVVPSYRTNNSERLERILRLDISTNASVSFWLVVDNPDESHLDQVKALVKRINEERFDVHGNFYITVLHYGENRGASYARNLGFNYSTADWTLFLDDDVEPSEHLIDAYIGAIQRYPRAKIFVGNTELPVAATTWTKMLRTCNIMFFYGISKHVPFPPWGVTANLMVRGSRHNDTIQFKSDYPKTGGGEDIDLCFQYKEWYEKVSGRNHVIVSVPGATALHPWWNNEETCYRQINGWAWGDSLCITQWPNKCFWAFPNWIEFIVFVVPLYSWWTGNNLLSCLATMFLVFLTEHLLLTAKYYSPASSHVKRGFWYKVFVACGAGTILSFQEVTRVAAHVSRGHFRCICSRVDWNDGQDPMVKLDTQLGSFLRFILFAVITLIATNVVSSSE